MSKVKIKSEKDLRKFFHTEDECVNYLIELRWGDKPKCPNCFSSRRVYFIKSRCAFKCSTCNKSMSVKAGTIFQNSKVDLVDWFQIIYKMATKKSGKPYCSTKLAEDFELTQGCSWALLHRIRYAMGLENRQKLRGVIEADEVYCGPQLAKDNKLRYKVYSAENQRIIHGLETEDERKSRKKREAKWEAKTKKVFKSLESRLSELIEQTKDNTIREQLISLDSREVKYPKHHYKKNTIGFLERDEYEERTNAKGETIKVVTKYGKLVVTVMGRQQNDINMDRIKPLLEQIISKNSILITDETGIYNSASAIVKKHYKIAHSKKKNMQHKPIKYSVKLKPEEDIYNIGYVSTNGMENVNKHIRTLERNYLHLSYKHFTRYLNEFVFAFNCRGMETHERFEKLMRYCISVSAQYDDKKFLEELNKYSHRPNRKINEKTDNGIY